MSVAIVGVTLLSVGYATAAVGLRRQRGGPIQWPRVWRMPLLVCGFWCVLALGLAGVTLRGEVETLVGVAGIAAEFVPELMYRVNPALLRGSAGRDVVETWLSEAAPGQLAQASAEGTGVQTLAPSGSRSGNPQRTPQGNLIAGSIHRLWRRNRAHRQATEPGSRAERSGPQLFGGTRVR
ncbi:hypothetical protein G7067_03005 [Leucobacter insecticola]|uniref:Uncharacterized protein n=1 Tax=Leucobacter insecticola TaxID=2714934 RepID=A0A6G8FGX2_9MICO|nr:hypothetical protein [Leucobacter insecticola]QIM15618.1 hypothetical protein G7067_03005 [Leucobacter insecticola]